jgi:hypothetical protein
VAQNLIRRHAIRAHRRAQRIRRVIAGAQPAMPRPPS